MTVPSFRDNAAQYWEDNPTQPAQPNNNLAIPPPPEVQALVEYREEPQRYRELMPNTGDEAFDAAIRADPALRKTWRSVEERDFTEKFSFTGAVWNSIARDSFLGNSVRLLDQVTSNLIRNDRDAVAIWDNRETLTAGISPEYHDRIINAPTMDLAVRESQRIRARELRLKKEYNTGFGKSMAADIAGFMLDPSNLLPGYGMIKVHNLARRTTALATLRSVATSPKRNQIFDMAVAGTFEEAIRMAPRFASDPTFEVNNYMEGIAMSAAFAGLLPAAFGVGGRALNKLPAFADDMNANLHAWGVDVGVRQAMRFPSELKNTGFKDPGTAARKSKEFAQDRVNQKVKEINKTHERRSANEAIQQDLKAETPGTGKLMGWAERRLEKAGDIAQDRLKLKLRRMGVHTALTAGATILTGPVGGVVTASLLANRDYIAVAAKYAVRAKKQRRMAYDAAVANGDHEAAAEILRSARTKPTPEETIEGVSNMINESVEKAKGKLREINEKAKVCA